ncbi:e3 ubiquitin-protein ligase rnf130-like protein [Vairimorpha apis BRL 01]|uniref:RING-type E3 ubiquitin transferase n=1 Tax=Vairimorpha apis BRL 01 TaxID=1037528 RepID=T0L7H4_9MICR|nr:e3 ubiquitin-protein ligase rnf130-like protein [Vairimorpha apis BRL 01]
METAENSEHNESPNYRLSVLSCIRFLIVVEICFKIIKIIVTSIILYITRNEKCKVPLKLFNFVYLLITLTTTLTYLSKNRNFFRILRINEFRENPDLMVFNNFIEAFLLFWYLLGFHWLQICPECKNLNPLLYWTTVLWVSIGVSMFIAPLLAIFLLLVFVTLLRPNLKVINYKGPADIPNDTYHCTICFEPYAYESVIKFLPCDHHFHSECVDEWLALRESCPLCKKNINILYELVDTPVVDL